MITRNTRLLWSRADRAATLTVAVALVLLAGCAPAATPLLSTATAVPSTATAVPSTATAIPPTAVPATATTADVASFTHIYAFGDSFIDNGNAARLGVVLFLREGMFGIKHQFRIWRDKKKSERRSSRSEKGGEMLPEEATESSDKDHVYFRRFDKLQREYLKTLITPQVIEEFKNKPLGQHSEALERGPVYVKEW